MLAQHLLLRIAIATLLLCSISLGGLDQSGDSDAKNLTISEFNAMVPANNLEGSFVDTGSPLSTSGDAGTEIAAYTEQAPPTTDLKKLMPSAVLENPPQYMYYNGDYLAWNDFSATFPSDNPGLWIERGVSWTFYATMPWGGWTRELIYVPQESPVTMYEIYPGGYVLGYDLGLVQPGYYYIWYYADAPGRHRSLFATNSGYSNAVIIDVYAENHIEPYPPTPSPKEKCEQNPLCNWVNGHCYCRGLDPEKEKCEQNPLCDWVNGHCYCRGLDPEKEKCEQNVNCEWVDGRCNCFMPRPDPEQENCEQNENCNWVNGHCYCRGLNPEPMPGPVPNPNPEQEPEPLDPVLNPVTMS